MFGSPFLILHVEFFQIFIVGGGVKFSTVIFKILSDRQTDIVQLCKKALHPKISRYKIFTLHHIYNTKQEIFENSKGVSGFWNRVDLALTE